MTEKLDTETERVLRQFSGSLYAAGRSLSDWQRTSPAILADLAREVQAIERDRCAKVAQQATGAAPYSMRQTIAAAIRAGEP